MVAKLNNSLASIDGLGDLEYRVRWYRRSNPMSSVAPGFADVRYRDGSQAYGECMCRDRRDRRGRGEEARKRNIQSSFEHSAFHHSIIHTYISYTTHLYTVDSRQLCAGTRPTLWVMGRRTDHRQWRTTDESSPTFIRHSPFHFGETPSFQYCHVINTNHSLQHPRAMDALPARSGGVEQDDKQEWREGRGVGLGETSHYHASSPTKPLPLITHTVMPYPSSLLLLQ